MLFEQRQHCHVAKRLVTLAAGKQESAPMVVAHLLRDGRHCTPPNGV
jgi:hypothetical protein